MSPADRDLLREIIEPVVEAEGMDLEELNVSQAGRRIRLQIIIDADGGVDLDRCADVSQEISRVLDERDAMGESPYTLEVSSPGVSRPLRLPRHWSRAVGRLVRVKMSDDTVLTGRVESNDQHSAVVDLDGESRQIMFDDVATARVQVEFTRTADAETG